MHSHAGGAEIRPRRRLTVIAGYRPAGWRGRGSRDPPPQPFRRAEAGNTIATVRARRARQGQHDPGSRGVHGRRGPPRPRVFRHAHEEHEAVVAALHAKAPRRARGTFSALWATERSVAQAVSRPGSADPRTTPWTQSLAPTTIRLDSAPGTRARGNDSIGQHTGASRADDHDCEGTESNSSPALSWHPSQDLRSRETNVSRRCAPPPTTSTRSLGVGRGWRADGRTPSELAENPRAANRDGGRGGNAASSSTS
jgi:hypothetical protein